jgi:hypothetical protein
MAISTRDALINALGNNCTWLVIDKASIPNTVAGQLFSLWRATGVPGQGAIPSTAAICTSALTGALAFANQTPPVKTYFGSMYLTSGTAATSVEFHDRLAHMGGLSGVVTTAQGALTLAGLAADRLGDADYSEVNWWLEWYTDTGGTSTTATVNVTFDDDSTGNLAGIVLGGTARASRLYPLVSNVAGRHIKAVNSVTLSATTGTAGNFGITATRSRAVATLSIANKTEQFDWAALALADVPNDACLQMLVTCSTTFTSVLRGGGKLIHG